MLLKHSDAALRLPMLFMLSNLIKTKKHSLVVILAPSLVVRPQSDYPPPPHHATATPPRSPAAHPEETHVVGWCAAAGAVCPAPAPRSLI